MLKEGNSKAQVCANNLLQLVRGEVPLDQLRGIRADITDMPSTTAAPYLQAAAYWVMEHYEPRLQFGDLSFSDGNNEGEFTTTTTLQ